MNAQSNSARGFAYIAAAIVIGAALVSASVVEAPSLQRTKTTTATSVSTTTLPQSTTTVITTLPQATTTTTTTLPPYTVTDEHNVTTEYVSTTTVTVTINTVIQPTCPFIPTAPGSSSTGPLTIGTSGTGSATNSSSERKTLVAAGLVWAFYTDGCNIVYQTSGDGGKTWSFPPIVARTGIERGWFFTLAQNGTTLYFVVSASDGSTNGYITYRNGTMNANGTVTWNTQEEDLPYKGDAPTVPTVALDTSGNVWIAIEDIGTAPGGNGGDRVIHVYKGSGHNWSDVLDVPGLADYPRPILLPLTAGKMALEILEEGPGQREVALYTTADGGTTWSPPLYTSSDNILTVSSVSVGDTVYTVTSDLDGGVSFWTYAYGASSFTGPTALSGPTPEGYDDAVISTDGSSFLFVAYANSTTVLDATSSDLGASWASASTIASGESAIQPGSLAVSALSTDLVPVLWTAQAGPSLATFAVRFAAMTIDLPMSGREG